MKLFKHFIFILTIFFSPPAHTQNITGTWEGRMTGEFIQINIVQKGNRLCGYTYDYEFKNRGSFCRAVFEGIYDPENELWYLSGRSFISNSGSHVLMRIVLQKDPSGNRNVLQGTVLTGSVFFGSEIQISRVSSRPQGIGTVMPPCFPPVAKTKPAPRPAPATVTPKPKPAPVKVRPSPAPATPKPKPTAPVLKGDTLKKQPAPATPQPKMPEKELVREMKLRKSAEQNRLEINSRKINLKLYDNGTVDGDTVSIFYNGRLLLSHQLLSEKAIELNIELDADQPLHEITMYAENLGGIPPNTALMVVTAGGKRYELRSKASLEENAVLVIEYKPGN